MRNILCLCVSVFYNVQYLSFVSLIKFDLHLIGLRLLDPTVYKTHILKGKLISF